MHGLSFTYLYVVVSLVQELTKILGGILKCPPHHMQIGFGAHTACYQLVPVLMCLSASVQFQPCVNTQCHRSVGSTCIQVSDLGSWKPVVMHD